jgi:hypothetical protein
MAGQAGWYRAPGEEGLLRYWNGTAWTPHRQPMPDATPPAQPSLAEAEAAPVEPVVAPSVAPTPIVESDPMAEYERQFTSTGSDVSDEAYVPVAQPALVPAAEPALTPAAQPAFTPALQSSFFTQPAFVEHDFSPRLTPVVSPEGPTLQTPDRLELGAPPAPVSAGAATTAEPETGLQHLLTEVRTAAENPHAQGIGEELGGAALAADGLIGFGRNRTGIFGALKGMGTSLVIVIIGLAVMGFLASNNSTAAGEVRGSGIVTSLGSTSGNSCTPVARFAVAGKSYSADSKIGISPCPVSLGQTVDVIYSSSDPASDARVEMGTSVTQFLWLIPVLGGVGFLASLFTFIVRAGSIAGGAALVLDGYRRRKVPNPVA